MQTQLSESTNTPTSTSNLTVLVSGTEPGNTSRLDLPRSDGMHNRSDFPAQRCKVELGHGATLYATVTRADPDTVCLYPDGSPLGTWGYKVEDVDPFIEVEVLGPATTKKRPLTEHERRQKYYPTSSSYGWGWNRQKELPARSGSDVILETYSGRYGTWEYPGYSHRHNGRGQFPYYYIPLKVTIENTVITKEFRFHGPLKGTIDLESLDNEGSGSTLTITVDFFGTPVSWTQEIATPGGLWTALQNHEIEGGTILDLWARHLAPQMGGFQKVPEAGVKALKKRKDIAPNLDRLKEEQRLLWVYFQSLHHSKTRDKMTNNRLLAAFLKEYGTDYDLLVKNLTESIETAHNHELISHYYSSSDEPTFRNVCLALPGAQEKMAEQKAKTQWQFQKTMAAQAEGLGISIHAYPLLMAAVGEGHIPLGVFHEPGKKDHLVNVEFDLWERAFERGWLEEISPIAQNCSGRGTYTHQMTGYLSFLFKIEKYLNRHAPRPDGSSWKAIPKYVQSQWELEMAEANEEGTVKRRSALTPVADNEEGTILVPYAAMAIHGRQTTYCYSHDYYLVEEGMVDPEGKGIFSKELEEGLNGRDDYGLMWYTLTGTPRNTGYPTFLIIFERTNRHGTRAHFHRVHPSRTRGPQKTPTPASRLIAECYRYMAGNVKATEIHAQQGDLIFLKVEGPGKAVEEPVSVAAFEGHAFVTPAEDPPAKLIRSVAKAPTNRLGYLYSENGFVVDHPEHEPLANAKMDGGWYEVRRCKSWEANPTAVWSFTID